MKILMLSAYDAPSHRYWREGLVAHLTEHEFVELVLPPRHFSWRIRGNPLSWYKCAEIQQQYDLVLATSMVDLATLRGLSPSLATVPAMYYFHENQFAYPVTARSHASLEPQMVTLYGSLAADKLLFNSSFNRTTFLQGVERLLNGFPDRVPAGIARLLEQKSSILAVPIELPQTAVLKQLPPFTAQNPLQIVWNHRWEYDKGPDRLLALINALPVSLPLRWHIVGQQFRQSPKQFDDIRQLLIQRKWQGAWGFIEDKARYRQLLGTSHCVVSTAIHDFQGISVLEAVAAGCVPIVPQRLAYTSLFDELYCYLSSDDLGMEAHAAAQKIKDYLDHQLVLVAPNLEFLGWKNLQPQYQALFLETAALRPAVVNS